MLIVIALLRCEHFGAQVYQLDPDYHYQAPFLTDEDYQRHVNQIDLGNQATLYPSHSDVLILGSAVTSFISYCFLSCGNR